ncbi:MAG TPA: hypothetical protein VFV75_08315 [Candidatus Polarisedimenticolaceae bacterium]|nr:hypothetical protein [Candidatus Polarisedimenticolaceae bacterium]
MRRIAVFWLGLVCTAVLVQGTPGAPSPPPPARKIPGITATDAYPHGCVDCHINYVDEQRDTRFKTLLASWSERADPALLAKAQATMPTGAALKGKHPAVGTALQSVPAKCLPCHSKTSKTAPPFAPLMHAIHLGGGADNPFLTVFQGECTHCHKLNAKTGLWSVPSAAEK